MKTNTMKTILTLLLLSFSSFTYSQSLENTEWEVYIEGYYQLNFSFSADTFYLSEEGYLIPFSIYTENSDTFNIQDLEYADGCFDEVGDVWGTYLFKIENDTLSFELIADECETRAETLVILGVFVRAVDTSTDDLNVFNQVTLFPNPLSDGVLNIQSKEKLDQVNIYDAYGKLLISSAHVTSIDLSMFSTHLFFVELRIGNERTIRKIVNL